MTQEEIKKIANEISENYSTAYGSACAFGYELGANECNAEWEKKTRWKELQRYKDGFLTLEQESELCKHFPILTKGMYGLQIIEILGGDLEKPHVCTHWKEII